MKINSIFYSVLKIAVLWAVALLFSADVQCVQAAAPGSAVSYAYPSGGQRGTTVRVLLGGRQIANVTGAEITGEGVSIRVVRCFKQMSMNSAEFREPANAFFQEELSIFQVPESERNARRAEMMKERKRRLNDPNRTEDEKAWKNLEELAENFVYWDAFLRTPAPAEVQTIYWEYFFNRPDKKPKDTLNQGVLVEVTIAPNAPCGTRWVTLQTPQMKTEPTPFLVGAIPEKNEQEPNDALELPARWNRETKKIETVEWALVPQETAALPVVWNGQIRPGDVDRFQFEAKKGQKLVLSVTGRALTPFLADAVPGWFQPVITLYAPDGTELQNACSYRNDPDPVMFFEVPQDGVYSAAVQDSLFRGRDDFVYRLSVGALEWISALYPPCAQAGTPFHTHLEGVNLPKNTHDSKNVRDSEARDFVVENPQGTPNFEGVPIAEVNEIQGVPLIHPVRYSVEREAPQEAAAEQNVSLPCVFYGRLAEAGKAAVFRFEAKKGMHITAEVTAQTFDSPLDARLEIRSEKGEILVKNDDRAGSDGPNIGTETHHADPIAALEIPEDGTYSVRLSNTLFENNPENIYRIRIAETEPDFLVFCQTPALLFNSATQILELQVVRLHGFDGPLEVVGTQPGIVIHNGLIPAGTTHAFCTVTVLTDFWPKPAPKADGSKPDGKTPVILPLPITVRSLEAEGKTVIERPIRAAMKREQAFIYFHYLPLGPVTAMFRGWQKFEYAPVTELPAVLHREGTTEVAYDLIVPWRKGKKAQREPGKATNTFIDISPLVPGIEVVSQNFDAVTQTLTLRVTNPEALPKEGVLLFEIFWKKEEEKAPQNKGASVGALPAIPYRLE